MCLLGQTKQSEQVHVSVKNLNKTLRGAKGLSSCPSTLCSSYEDTNMTMQFSTCYEAWFSHWTLAERVKHYSESYSIKCTYKIIWWL